MSWSVKLPCPWLWLGLALAGCATVPAPLPATTTSRERLASHVRFLCQPELGGRKPRTAGSRAARHYLATRFHDYGLIPWDGSSSFEQSFGFGRNIIGILPGTDPDAGIVLVSAHYDHLGKDSQGRLCRGAADNAAGVAALLETARQLSLDSGRRHKRTIAFATFDCEESMLLGSFAFTCRKDVEQAKIAAVVNVDILGRKFLEVVENTLFLTGTEAYPELQQTISRIGTDAGLRILTAGTDLVGPRSDHVAFEARDIPCLFFSSGVYRDYHQPTDTPDKLDQTALDRSAQVILGTVKELADRPIHAPNRAAEQNYAGELRTISTIMAEVSRNSVQAGIKEADAEALQKLGAEAQALLQSGRYDHKARERLILQAAGPLELALFPLSGTEKMESEEHRKEAAAFVELFEYFYLQYRRDILEGYRQLVQQLVAYRPGVFRRMPTFLHEIYEIDDGDAGLSLSGTGEPCALHALVNQWKLGAGFRHSKLLLPPSFQVDLSISFSGMDCEGSSQQIADYCLLRLRREQENDLHFAKTKMIFDRVIGTSQPGGYAELLRARLALGKFKDEVEWIVACIGEDVPDLTLEALKSSADLDDPRLAQVVCQVISNRNLRPDVRAAAIRIAKKDRPTLLALCDALEDTTPAPDTRRMPLLKKYYPSVAPLLEALAPVIDQLDSSGRRQKTIGSLAHERLKTLIRRDRGTTAQAWRQWLDAHAPKEG